MTRAGNGVDDSPAEPGVGDEHVFEVVDCFFWVEAVEVDVEFVVGDVCGGGEVLVSFFVEGFGGIAVGFAHGVVFGLASEGEGFGGSGIVSVPGLCGARIVSVQRI